MSISTLVVTTSLIALLAFASSLCLFIILGRLISSRRDKKQQEQSRLIEKDLLRVIATHDQDLARTVALKHKKHARPLLTALIFFLETISGKEQELIKLVFDLALKKRIKKKLRSPFSITRLKAARPFILFSGIDDTESIMRLLQDKPIIRLTAINTLARIPNKFTLSKIFETFEKDPEPNLQAYAHVFYSLGASIEKILKEYFIKPLATEKLCLLIELAGSIPLPKLYQELLSFTRHLDKEVRIKTARALGRINVPLPEVTKALEELTGNEEWEVQAQAYKSMGQLRNPASLPILSKALYSSYWYCRLNAGFSLAYLGQDGMKYLQQAAKQKKDPYAADMAKMVQEQILFFPVG